MPNQANQRRTLRGASFDEKKAPKEPEMKNVFILLSSKVTAVQ
jgi:hypothetical protein